MGKVSSVASYAARRSSPRDSPRAVLLGDRDMAATLSRADIPVTVVCKSSDPLRYSRYADDWIHDRGSNDDERVENLVNYAARRPHAHVLFYQTDEALLLVSRHRAELSKSFKFVVADAEVVESLLDKAAFQELATHLDLPIPPGRVISTTRDESLALDLLPPLLVKPLRRDGSWEASNSGKANLVRDRRELAELLERLRQTRSRVLVQRHIPGPESQVESYHAYIDTTGATVGEFTGRKLRTYPTSYGYSTALLTTAADDVIGEGRQIVTKLSLRGVVKIDFKRDLEGKLWLLEANPRFNLWHRLGAAAGVDIPALVFDDLMGLPGPRPTSAREGVAYCRMIQDWHSARQQGVPVRDWLRFVANSEVRSNIDVKDLPAMLTAKLASSWARLHSAAHRRGD